MSVDNGTPTPRKRHEVDLALGAIYRLRMQEAPLRMLTGHDDWSDDQRLWLRRCESDLVRLRDSLSKARR